jgi:hypothetical protein
MRRRFNETKTLRAACQRLGVLCALSFVTAIVGCSRTGLDPSDLGPFEDELETGGSTGMLTPLPDAGPDASMPDASMPDASTPDASSMPDEVCVPSPEECNGRDDDCNHQVDDLPGEPCPGGGFRYCIAGRLSECPRSCEVCVPGSIRICQNSFCTFWGEQECSADGQGFGRCREGVPPPRCASVARREHASAALEQCCIDDGYCCLDSHDLDHDGNRTEMIGACDGVACQ